MLTERGRVVAVENDGLWVETHKLSACDACSAQKGCGHTLVANTLVKNMSLVKAYFAETSLTTGGDPEKVLSISQRWECGDEVDIGIDEHKLILATLTSYIPPLVVMLVFTLMASHWTRTEGLIAVSAFSGLALGGLISRHLIKKHKNRSKLRIAVLSSQALG